MVWSDLINSSTDCNTINTWFTLCIIRKHVTIAILALISQDASPQMENSCLSKEYFVSQGKLKTIYDQNFLQAENNLFKKENQRLSKIREFCLRYFQICPVDSQPSLVSPWRAVVNANFRISHEAKISNELSFMDLFHFQAPLLLSSKDDKSARPIMVQSSLDYQSQLYESMSFNCHSPRNDKCLIFIFLISVGSHKSWRVLRLVTVRLHEILNLDAIAC